MSFFCCDGCERGYRGKYIVINAKKWNENICNGPFLAEFEDCIKYNCRYNVEGMCVEFYFCKNCAKDSEMLNKRFADFHH